MDTFGDNYAFFFVLECIHMANFLVDSLDKAESLPIWLVYIVFFYL
jgi:hypothetical protein